MCALTLSMIFLFRINLESVTNDKIIEQRINSAQSQCTILANQVVANDFMIASDTDNLNAEIDQLANVYDGRIMIINYDYKIIKDTYTIEQGKYIVNEDVFAVMRGDVDKTLNSVDDYTEIIMPILDTNQNIQGVIIAMVTVSDANTTIEYLHRQGTILFVLFAIITMALAKLNA